MVKVVIDDKKGIVESVGTGVTVSNTQVSHTGAVTTSGNFNISGKFYGVQPTVENLGANGSIPVTSLTVNVDANGSNRTGIRFGGAGTAGQMIIVQNTGGEELTFHGTEGTALVKGIANSNDTMEPGGTYMFVSNGTLWHFIGGSVATNAQGLTAGS